MASSSSPSVTAASATTTTTTAARSSSSSNTCVPVGVVSAGKYDCPNEDTDDPHGCVSFTIDGVAVEDGGLDRHVAGGRLGGSGDDDARNVDRAVGNHDHSREPRGPRGIEMRRQRARQTVLPLGREGLRGELSEPAGGNLHLPHLEVEGADAEPAARFEL